jgi:hypothetical protein
LRKKQKQQKKEAYGLLKPRRKWVSKREKEKEKKEMLDCEEIEQIVRWKWLYSDRYETGCAHVWR